MFQFQGALVTASRKLPEIRLPHTPASKRPGRTGDRSRSPTSYNCHSRDCPATCRRGSQHGREWRRRDWRCPIPLLRANPRDHNRIGIICRWSRAMPRGAEDENRASEAPGRSQQRTGHDDIDARAATTIIDMQMPVARRQVEALACLIVDRAEKLARALRAGAEPPDVAIGNDGSARREAAIGARPRSGRRS